MSTSNQDEMRIRGVPEKGSRKVLFMGRRFIYGLLAGVLFINVLAVVTVVYGLKELKERDLEQAMTLSQNLAQGVTQSLAYSIEKVDFSLRILVGALEKELADGQRQSAIVEQQHFLHQFINTESDAFGITNADGDVIERASVHAHNINVADRDYFMALKTGRVEGLSVSAPLVSRLTGKSVLTFARAYRNRGGSFAGVVMVPVPLSYFKQLIGSFTVGERSVVGVRTVNFELIARNPAIMGGKLAQPGDRSNISKTLQDIVSSGAMEASYQSVAPDENTHRVVAFRRLAVAPIIVIAGIAEQEYLQDWYGIRDIAVGSLALFMLATSLFAWMAYQYWLRHVRDSIALHTSYTHLQSALETVNERDKALRAVQNVGSLGIYSMDIVNGTWDSSSMLDVILGIDASYPRTKDALRQLLHEDDLASAVVYFYDDVLASRKDFDREYRIIRRTDGAVRWVHIIGKLEFGDDGKPVRMNGAAQDITELKESIARVEFLAYHDELTRLPNRTLLADRMRQAIAMCQRRNEVLGVCYLDLDDFKPINDEWGHAIGDQLLVEVSRRLRECTRAGDTVARLGGDEFVVLFGHQDKKIEIEYAIERIRRVVSEPYRINGLSIQISASVGVTFYPDDAAEDADTLIRHADQAMYAAKRDGKNRVHIFDPESDISQRKRRARYARLVEALDHGEFCLHYQPIVDLRSGEVVGVEALLRWQHPEDGLLMPGTFLPDVEDTELTLALGEWVIRACLRQKQRWGSMGIDLQVSVNLFGKHLQRSDFVERLKNILLSFPDASPACLRFEILETTAMDNLDDVSRNIRECAHLGISFALDDFGTGFSSLTYFRQLPIKAVKIDRSFVIDMLQNQDDLALIHGIVGMAHSLERQVVAEGVETIAHGIPLLHCGCDVAQGYGIARPMPADALPEWLARWEMPAVWKMALVDGNGSG